MQILAQDVAHNSRPQPPAPGSVAAAMAAKRAAAAAAAPRLTEVQHKEHVAAHLTEVQKEWPNGDIPPGETPTISHSPQARKDSLLSVAHARSIKLCSAIPPEMYRATLHLYTPQRTWGRGRFRRWQ